MKEKWAEKWTKTSEKLFKGDVILPKTTLWLVCSVCLLAGIVYGLKKAPWTHGVTICSNNGNNNGNNSGNSDSSTEDAADQEAEKEEE